MEKIRNSLDKVMGEKQGLTCAGVTTSVAIAKKLGPQLRTKPSHEVAEKTRTRVKKTHYIRNTCGKYTFRDFSILFYSSFYHCIPIVYQYKDIRVFRE